MPAESFETKVVKILRSILINNDNLSMFLNSFSFGKLSSNGSFSQTARVRFYRDPEKDSVDTNYYSDNNNTLSPCIRISDYTPRDISVRSIRDESGRYNNNNFFFQYVYNRWDERCIATQMGINVNRKINIKGYMLNFTDVKKIMQDCSDNVRNGYYDSADYINTFYFVGSKNSLFALSTVSGLLYIRRQTLVKLFENNDIESITKALKNLLVCFKQLVDKFTELNVKQYKEELAEIVEQNALAKIVNGDRMSRRYYRSYTRNEAPEEFMNTVKQYIKDSIGDATVNTIFGIKDSYSYGNIINEILNTKKQNEKAIFNQGFQKGMRIGLKIEMLGWRPVDVNFADDHSSSMWWEKEVNIIPNNFMYNRERYIIPEKDRCFKVDKMYINQDGILRCHGNHPNVQGSKVCMGDLVIKFGDELSDIQDVLRRAEELLDMINYDSAYHRDKLDHLLKVSKKDELLGDSSLVRDQKKKSSTIKELGALSDSDDDEDEEEIVEEKKSVPVVKIIKDKKQAIAEIISNPQPRTVNNEELEHRSSYTDQYVATNEAEHITSNNNNENVPVYISQDASTLTEISHVQSDGERRPLVFVAGPGVGGTAAVVNNTEELSLGDSNLLIQGSN